MSEMVEKVAQAIRDHSSQRDADDWDRIKEIDREFWRGFAHATLAAMRDVMREDDPIRERFRERTKGR